MRLIERKPPSDDSVVACFATCSLLLFFALPRAWLGGRCALAASVALACGYRADAWSHKTPKIHVAEKQPITLPVGPEAECDVE